MLKKKWIITAGTLTAVAAFAVGVAVPIAVRDHEKSWTVKIANSSGGRYTLTQLDPSSNKPKLTDDAKQIWDLKDTDEHKRVVASYLDVTEPSQIQLAISGGEKYSNGLEKLFYDLTKNFSKNADNLTLSFAGVKGAPNVAFDKAFINASEADKHADLESIVTSTAILSEGNAKTEAIPAAKKVYDAKKEAYDAAVKESKPKAEIDAAKAAMENAKKDLDNAISELKTWKETAFGKTLTNAIAYDLQKGITSVNFYDEIDDVIDRTTLLEAKTALENIYK